ncbi:MAG: hypothetical protein CME06_17915 [Gemmatimonadetes bacterium]|nr:hypothetical protein [Gemmatimonadota bacterium]
MPEGGWRVGVADPAGAARVVEILTIESGAVATSGTFDNAREIDGQRVSHFIDPRAAEPLSAAPRSTLVRAADATLADSLATALHVEPKLIERAEQLGASKVFLDGRTVAG